MGIKDDFLTTDEFQAITKAKCHFCGAKPPSMIERIDTDGKFVFANCVAICKWCRKAKGSRTYAEYQFYLNGESVDSAVPTKDTLQQRKDLV